MRPVGINVNIKLPLDNGKLVSPYYANSVILQDPTEGFTAYHRDWNFGLMNGFAEAWNL